MEVYFCFCGYVKDVKNVSRKGFESLLLEYNRAILKNKFYKPVLYKKIISESNIVIRYAVPAVIDSEVTYVLRELELYSKSGFNICEIFFEMTLDISNVYLDHSKFVFFEKLIISDRFVDGNKVKRRVDVLLGS